MLLHASWLFRGLDLRATQRSASALPIRTEYTYSPRAARRSETGSAAVERGAGCIDQLQSSQAASSSAIPDVRSTLEWVALQQYTIVAVSNAPTTLPTHRAPGPQALFLDGLVEKEAKSREDPLRRSPNGWRTRDQALGISHCANTNSSRARCWSSVLDHYGRAVDLGCRRLLSSDIAPAGTLGIRTIWARYGSVAREKDIETLLRVTDWRIPAWALESCGRSHPRFC